MRLRRSACGDAGGDAVSQRPEAALQVGGPLAKGRSRGWPASPLCWWPFADPPGFTSGANTQTGGFQRFGTLMTLQGPNLWPWRRFNIH